MQRTQVIRVVPTAVIGSGYVGLVAAACLAELGHDVVCVDIDHARVDLLQSGEVPIFEKGLNELLSRHRGQRLRFTYNLSEAVRFAQVVVIAVGTPQSSTGEADLSQVEDVVTCLASALDCYKVVVEKSTVPVLTSHWVAKILQLNGVPKARFDVVANPEFLREGSAISDFLYPDRIVVGADLYQPLIDGSYYKREERVHDEFTAVRRANYIETSTSSAELIKQASNAFLALKVSFINAVSNICERVNVDIEEVARGVGADRRIGPHFLRAGIGYGGSCFPKDIRAFRQTADAVGYNFDLLDSIEQINEHQHSAFMKKVRAAVWSIKGKEIAVLGLAFKSGTDDIRESPAIAIVRSILSEGGRVAAFDPAAMNKCRSVLPENEELRYAWDEYDAARNAQALVILTEWPQFSQLDMLRLRQSMRYPIIIDGRNLYNPSKMSASGFYYHSIGRPCIEPHSERRELVDSTDMIRNARYDGSLTA